MKDMLEEANGQPRIDRVAPSRKRSNKVTKTMAKIRPPSIFQCIYEPYQLPMTTSASKLNSVLVRRTAKAENFRQRNRHLFPVCNTYKDILARVKASKASAEGLHSGRGEIKLLKLPAELRVQIYDLVVVEKECLIYPTSATGREQPDLAMTCRAIRMEVLPLFYGQNTFAIDLSPLELVTHMAAAKSSAIEGWSRVLTEGGWFRYIRKWVFCYERPFARTIELASTNDCDQVLPPSVMVSLVFPKQAVTKGIGDTDDKDNNVAGAYSLPSPSVEVHENAFCLLPSHDLYGMCCLSMSPDWLNKLIIEAFDMDVTSGVTMEKILEIVRGLEQNIRGLGNPKCCRKQVRVRE